MDNLEEFIDGQCKRMRQLDGATILIKGKRNIKDELDRMHDKVSEVSYGIENMRKSLEKMREQNTSLRELLSLTKTLDKRIVYQEENVPPEVIQDYINADKRTCVPAESSLSVSKCTINLTHQLTGQKTPKSAYGKPNFEKQEAIEDCKRMLFTEPEICPTIPFIAVEEFNKIPKYIIGRQSLETINNLINAINQTLIAKYTILSAGKSVAQRKGEINLYLHYKKQELDVPKENGYLYFFTAEDFHSQTKTKIDKTKLNLLTALRHCKRLRECRIRNELRYIITPH